jgi:hypothetical protein
MQWGPRRIFEHDPPCEATTTGQHYVEDDPDDEFLWCVHCGREFGRDEPCQS